MQFNKDKSSNTNFPKNLILQDLDSIYRYHAP